MFQHSDLNLEIMKSRPTVVINRLHLCENGNYFSVRIVILDAFEIVNFLWAIIGRLNLVVPECPHNVIEIKKICNVFKKLKGIVDD